MKTTNTTKVSILGVEYTLRGDAETERISELASYVDEKLRQAKSRSGQPQDMSKVAILTSLNIAYELFSTRADARDQLEHVRRRASELADRLDRCLSDGPPAVVEPESGSMAERPGSGTGDGLPLQSRTTE